MTVESKRAKTTIKHPGERKKTGKKIGGKEFKIVVIWKI